MTCLVASAQSTTQSASLREFHAFSATHAAVVIAFVILAAIVLAIGVHLRRRDPTRLRRCERALGIAGLAIWLFIQTYGFLPGVFAWHASLPLHVCDIASLLGPLVMLNASPKPWMRSLLYFAGIGLCTQAFITPVLNEGPADPQFWCFWSGHFIILIPALYDLVVRRWRPKWRDWLIACVLSLGYAAVIFSLDIASGWNYGFLGQAREPGTMIEVLGRWPWRVAIIIGLTALAYTLMMLPWRLLRDDSPD